MGVHAGIQAFLHVLGVGVGAHGDDGHSPGTGLPAGADGPGRGVAVHDRHHQVHQNRIVARRVGGKGAHGALAVKRLDDLGPGAFQHELDDLHVQLVILDNQQALAVQVGGGFLLRPGGGRVVVYGKRQRDSKAAALPHRALDGDRAVHLLHQLVHDGHTQPGAAVLGARGVVLLAERLKQVVVNKVLRHADAGIPDRERIGRGVGGAAHLPQAGGDAPAGLVVLDGVAVQVHKDLFQVERTAQQVGVVHIVVVRVQPQPALLRLKADDVIDLGKGPAEVEGLCLDHKAVALDLAHVQHVVDEGEQVLSRNIDLAQAVIDPRLVAAAVADDLQHAQNAVDGRADVVGHVGQKARLGAVGAGLALQRILQLLADVQVAARIPDTDLFLAGQHQRVVGLLLFQRGQHQGGVAGGFGVFIAADLGPQTDLGLLGVAAQVGVHGVQHPLDLRIVPGIHAAVEQHLAGGQELLRVQPGQVLPKLGAAAFVPGGVARLIGQQRVHDPHFLGQDLPAPVGQAFGKGILCLVQPVQMAADLRQIAVDVGVHHLIGGGHVFLCLADGLKRLPVVLLGQIGHGKVVVLIGVTADLVVFPRNFKALMNVEAGQCVLLHIVGHHADEVEAGDDLRAVPVAFVVDDERLQNFPHGAEVALAVKEQRIAEVRHHPHIGLFGLPGQYIGKEGLALRQWGVFQFVAALVKFFVGHHRTPPLAAIC